MKRQGKHHLPPKPMIPLSPDWIEAPHEFKLTLIKGFCMFFFVLVLLVILSGIVASLFTNPQFALAIGVTIVVALCVVGFYFWVSYFVNKDLHK